MNSISYLLEHKFSLLSHVDKIRIKELGRPTPEMKIDMLSSSRKKTYIRHFNKSVYNHSNWICGCEEKNALFCFPCVLFGGDKTWTVSGCADLTHLSQNIKRHESKKTHISNEVSLALLGNINIQTQLDSAYWIQVQRHNDQVTKNRYVLSRIIDCIKFCGAFELAHQGHESDGSDNTGVFHGLVNFSADLDNALRERLDSGNTFKEPSKDIQNELLQCMLEVCRENIIAEIGSANYLAVMAEETSDVASKFQVVVVLRYVKQGNPVERFVGFVHPKRHDAESLAACIESVIDPLLTKNPSKLIAQSYDGATVMSRKHRSVHAIIKEKYPQANFVHCYAYQLNLIMSQTVSQNPQVRVFFSNVNDIVNFFVNSRRNQIFNEVIGTTWALQTHYNFKTRAVNIIYEHRISLIECMQNIQERILNSKIINQASAIERLLDDDVFHFWLNIFYHVMPHVDTLNDQLQKRKTDTVHIKIATRTFETCINNFMLNIDEIIQDDPLRNDLEPTPKRMRLSKQSLRAAAVEACHVIIHDVKERFECLGHLEVESLFSSELFNNFSHKFPGEIVTTLGTLYPNVFDLERLKTELSIIYSRRDFGNIKGAVSFLNMLKANNLDQPFRETIKLLEILLTIPMTTVEADRYFSTLKRVKNYLRNSMDDDRLSALSMLSIENDLVKTDSDFNNKVIEKFARAKQGRADLNYKK